MSLNDDQKNTVRQWVDDGLQMNDIQKKLADELGVNLTYMDLRFLLSDLALTPKDVEEPEEEKVDEPAAEYEAHDLTDSEEGMPEGADPFGGGASDVSITVDEITRPGYAISGKVTFSDGKKAEWFFDQYGSPGITTEEPGYRPSEADLMAFQKELHRILSRTGM